MNYLDFVNEIYTEILPNKHKSLRDGQALINYLFTVNKDLHDEILGTEFDCFYNDKKVDKTLVYLADNWRE